VNDQKHGGERRAHVHALQKCATRASWDKLRRATAAGGGNAGFYLACGAAGALLQHLMDEAQVLAHTLAVELVGTSAHMRLDAGKCSAWWAPLHPHEPGCGRARMRLRVRMRLWARPSALFLLLVCAAALLFCMPVLTRSHAVLMWTHAMQDVLSAWRSCAMQDVLSAWMPCRMC